MVLDGLRGYLQLANGLTDVTRERAMATAKIMLAQGEAAMSGAAMVPAVMPDNVKALTDDLIATSKANRDLMINLVRSEVERSVGRLGLVSAAELEAAQRRAKRLEERVLALETELRAANSRTGASTAKKSPARKAAAKKSTAKKTAKKSTTRKAAAKRSTTKQSAAKESTS